jgi:hypothetical protein
MQDAPVDIHVITTEEEIITEMVGVLGQVVVKVIFLILVEIIAIVKVMKFADVVIQEEHVQQMVTLRTRQQQQAYARVVIVMEMEMSYVIMGAIIMSVVVVVQMAICAIKAYHQTRTVQMDIGVALV